MSTHEFTPTMTATAMKADTPTRVLRAVETEPLHLLPLLRGVRLRRLGDHRGGGPVTRARTTTPRVKHRTGAGARINADNIWVYRTVVVLVTPPAARDIIGVLVESLGVEVSAVPA